MKLEKDVPKGYAVAQWDIVSETHWYRIDGEQVQSKAWPYHEQAGFKVAKIEDVLAQRI